MSVTFGEIENIQVGQIFDSRESLAKARIHTPPMNGCNPFWGSLPIKKFLVANIRNRKSYVWKSSTKAILKKIHIQFKLSWCENSFRLRVISRKW